MIKKNKKLLTAQSIKEQIKLEDQFVINNLL